MLIFVFVLVITQAMHQKSPTDVKPGAPGFGQFGCKEESPRPDDPPF